MFSFATKGYADNKITWSDILNGLKYFAEIQQHEVILEIPMT
jgi:hypothetical protein